MCENRSNSNFDGSKGGQETLKHSGSVPGRHLLACEAVLSSGMEATLQAAVF